MQASSTRTRFSARQIIGPSLGSVCCAQQSLATEGEGSGSQSLKVMQQNTRIVVLTLEVCSHCYHL